MELPKGLALLNVKDLATMIEVSSSIPSNLLQSTDAASGMNRTSKIVVELIE